MTSRMTGEAHRGRAPVEVQNLSDQATADVAVDHPPGYFGTMRILAAIALLSSMPCAAQPGPWWAYGFGGPADDRFTAIAQGPGDTLYACGTFSGAMHAFGEDHFSAGVTDVLIAKFDTSGTVYWVSTAGGPGVDRATDIAVDPNGDIIVVGQFSGTFQAGDQSLTSNGPSQDIFLAKWDPTGTALWARAAGSSGNTDIAEQVALDGAGNIFMAGQFSGNALFDDLSITSTFDPLLNALGDDVFIARYTTNGDAVWVKKGAAIHQDQTLGLAVDPDGNSWLAGRFSDVMTFDQAHPNTINNAAFIAAFDPTGAEQWYRRIGGGGSVLVGDLAFDAGTVWMGLSQSGNNIVFGDPNTVITSTYPYSACAVAFSSAGGVAAQRTVGSDHPIGVRGIDVRYGEVALVGDFQCQPLELSLASGGDGLLLSWGEENGWICTLDQADDLAISYAQVIVDQEPMELRDVLIGEDRALFTAGEFAGDLYIPSIEDKMRVYPGDSLVVIGPDDAQEACGDTTYYDASRLFSHGVLDGFIMKGAIRQRRALDILMRQTCTFDLDVQFDVFPAAEPDCIVPGVEASFCGEGTLAASFDFDHGPLPEFLWSNGATTAGIPILGAGTFSATGNVGQGCITGSDAITVSLCEPVGMPGISDDQGINFQDTLTQAVSVCEPTLITLTAGPIPGISFTWVHPSGSFPGDTSITPLVGGIWYLETVNAAGCGNVSDVSISYLSSDTLGEVDMVQTFQFPQDVDGNDSITICANEGVLAELSLDLFLDGVQVGSAGSFILSDTVTVNGGVNDQGGFDMAGQPKHLSAAFTGDGWYVFESLIHISDEPCNDNWANGTGRDSIYVTSIPGGISQVDIVGSIFLCSGQSVELVAVANGPGTFEWGAENGGIVGPTNTDSLVLTVAGPVHVIFTPQDTGACTTGAADSHAITLISAPSISMDPVDGLICPGEAVNLQVTGVTGSYAWYGPGGPLPQTTPSIQVSDAGTYYCVASTVEGCTYATALRTVSLYTTPYLSVLPQPVLCEGGSVQVSVQPATGGSYDWAPPLSGNGPTQVITAPGTYSVSVTQCGEVTPLSFTVTQSDPTAAILDEGPFDICPLDSALLQAAPGLVAYAWQPGNLTGQQVYTSEEGSYALIGFDAYGCSDTAYAAVVNVHDFVDPVVAVVDTACAGETTNAIATGTGVFAWYADATALDLIGFGSSVTLGPFSGPTVIYITQTDAQCMSLPVAVDVPVVPGVIPTAITGDTIVCIGGALLLNAAPGVDLAWSTPLGPFTGPTAGVSPATPAANGTWAVTASQSGCVNGSASVLVIVPDPQVDIVDPGPFEICPGDSVLLAATSPQLDHVWFPGALHGQQAYAQDTGHYHVIGTDQYGCTDSAGVVIIGGFFYSLPITAQADEVCAGDTALAVATGSGTIVWYADAAMTQLLGTGPQWPMPSITGSTTLYVTQTEAQCTSDPLAVPIPVIPLPPLPQILGDVSLCTGDPMNLIVLPQYNPTWTTPNGTVTTFIVNSDYATPALDGPYSVFYTVDGCAGPSASVEVSVVPLPLVDLGPPLTLCIGETAVLDAGPALMWAWSTGSSSQTITVGVPGTYWVTILDMGGCTDTDSLLITQDDCEVDIPNHITPNGDGVNDVITLTSPSGDPLTLEIFNRWGQRLYIHTARVVQWDGHNGFSGEPVPEGVYYYVLTASLVNGDPFVRSGYWHVMR